MMYFPLFTDCLRVGYQIKYYKSIGSNLAPTDIFKIPFIFEFLVPCRARGLIIAANSFLVALLTFAVSCVIPGKFLERAVLFNWSRPFSVLIGFFY